MFQIERLQKIRQILSEQKSADVFWLSSYLKVSEVTIRRDLEKLESEGFLKRTYGGAILDESFQDDSANKALYGNSDHHESNISEKSKVLGELCATLIEDHDVIFLGRSECNATLADSLKTKSGVVVFTNNLDVLQIMSRDRKNKVILTGGEVNYDKGIMCNSSVNIPFPDIHVNKAFLHIQGADLDYGLTVNEREDAYAYEELRKRTKNMIAIMEGSVFDKIGLIRVDDICGINYVVTDGGIPEEYKRYFYKNGIRLHQKFDF